MPLITYLTSIFTSWLLTVLSAVDAAKTVAKLANLIELIVYLALSLGKDIASSTLKSDTVSVTDTDVFSGVLIEEST